MTQRERNLSIILLVAIFLMVGGFFGYRFILAPLSEQRRLIAQLEGEVDEREKRVDEIQYDLRTKYQPLRKLSLPHDVDLARREYEMQLSGLLRKSDFQPAAITITPRPADTKTAPTIAPKKPAYTKLAFVVTVKGELANFVDFLDHFYRQPLLHQIRTMNISRPSRAGERTRLNELEINMMIEAIVLEDAEKRLTLAHVPDHFTIVAGVGAGYRIGALAVETGKGSPYELHATGKGAPTFGQLANPARQYASIAGKDVFFGPPPPPERKREPERVDDTPKEPDLAPYIRLTSLSESDGQGRAHLFDFYNKHDYQIEQAADGTVTVEVFYFIHDQERNQDRKKRLNKGRDLEIGDTDGGNYVRLKILKLADSDIYLQVPEDDKEKKARQTAAAAIGGLAHTVSSGKIYKWHVGQLMKEMVLMSAAEVKAELRSVPAGTMKSRPGL